MVTTRDITDTILVIVLVELVIEHVLSLVPCEGRSDVGHASAVDPALRKTLNLFVHAPCLADVAQKSCSTQIPRAARLQVACAPRGIGYGL